MQGSVWGISFQNKWTAMRGTPGKSSKMMKPIEESSYLGGLKKMDNSLKPLPRWEIITVHKNFKGRKRKKGYLTWSRRWCVAIDINERKGNSMTWFLVIRKLIWKVPEGHQRFKERQGLCRAVAYEEPWKSLDQWVPTSNAQYGPLSWKPPWTQEQQTDYSDSHLLNGIY